MSKSLDSEMISVFVSMTVSNIFIWHIYTIYSNPLWKIWGVAVAHLTWLIFVNSCSLLQKSIKLFVVSKPILQLSPILEKLNKLPNTPIRCSVFNHHEYKMCDHYRKDASYFTLKGSFTCKFINKKVQHFYWKCS